MDKSKIESLKKKINTAMVMSPFPEDPFHAINTLEWLIKLNPDADDALQIAALGHDIERAFKDKTLVSNKFDTYDEYKNAHAFNSAQILGEVMEEMDFEDDFVQDVVSLVALHESGGDERADVLRDADNLSFFHVCLPLYYDRKGPERTKKRCVWGYRRLSDDLKALVEQFEYMDEELEEILAESLNFRKEKGS